MGQGSSLGAIVYPIRPMRMLITGGFGYLGSRLAQYFALQDGYDIVLGSRTSQKAPAWLPQASVINIPWDSPSGLDDVCAGVDVIIQAAGVNAQDCATDPVGAFEFNAVATGRLLQAAIQQGIKRFIYISTAHVYGSPLIGRITENSCPNSLHPYATSHRGGEDIVRYAHQRGQIEGIVVRLSNAFGAPSHKDANCWMLLVNDLCRQLIQTRKLALQSSGLQSRDFITMNNVARAIDHLLNLPSLAIADGLFNLGGGRSITVLEMAELISERGQTEFGIDVKVTRPEPGKNDKLTSLVFDITKLQQTGFKLTDNMNFEIDNTLRLCTEMSGDLI